MDGTVFTSGNKSFGADCNRGYLLPRTNLLPRSLPGCAAGHARPDRPSTPPARQGALWPQAVRSAVTIATLAAYAPGRGWAVALPDVTLRGRCLSGVCGRTSTARFVPCARTAFYSRCRKRSFCNKTRRERSLGAVYKALSRDLGSQHHRGWRRSPAPIRAPAPQRHIPRPLRSLLSGRGSASGVT